MLLVLLFGLLQRAAALQVSLPLAEPPEAQNLSQNLVGFSIESDRWPEWVGVSEPNSFWINTLNNLKDLTGKPPIIRVGANSADRTTFVDSQMMPTLGKFPGFSTTMPYPEADNNTIGPSFYSISSYLPSNTRMIWGLNLGANDSDNAIAEARNIIAAFNFPELVSKGIELDMFELGNEPDLLAIHGLRPANYTVHNFVSEWNNIAGAITTALGLTKGKGPSWLAVSLAESDHGAGGFSPQQAFADGMLSSAAGQLISTISQHHYSGAFCAGPQGVLSDLMSKAAIRGNLTAYNPDIAATKARGLAYRLGETNSYACHGTPNVSNTAGAAIWLLDYALQAAVLGIDQIYLHGGIGYKYNLVQPVPLNRSILTGEPENSPARVQPAYYAPIAIAEAIGKSGRTTISELQMKDPHVAAYAIYEEGALVRAVFINSQSWESSSTEQRPTIQLDLSFLSQRDAPTKATLKRLTIGYSDDTANVTWGGLSYETSTGLASGSPIQQHIDVGDGFILSATEAVLVAFSE